MQIKDLTFGFGSLTYKGQIGSTPSPIEREAENAGSVCVEGDVYAPGALDQPAYSEASFDIEGNVETAGITSRFAFALIVPICNKIAKTPYWDIESEGVRQIAVILRLLAQGIEKRLDPEAEGFQSVRVN